MRNLTAFSYRELLSCLDILSFYRSVSSLSCAPAPRHSVHDVDCSYRKYKGSSKSALLYNPQIFSRAPLLCVEHRRYPATAAFFCASLTFVCTAHSTMATEKCFAKGSVAPGPVPKGQIRLYSMRFCPFAQRTRLVLNAKGIKHETINIHLKEKPDWFLEKNPLGLVPTLETEAGEVVYESPITCDYLDEVYPQNKLLPSTPFAKAKQKMMLEHFSKVPPYFYKIVMAKKDGQDISGLVAELKEKFVNLDEDLVKKKTKFFGGDSITMIDYMMWPWFERLETIDLKHLLDSTPELKKWYGLMQEDPAVKASSYSTDTYKAFFKTAYIDGKPDYDYGL